MLSVQRRLVVCYWRDCMHGVCCEHVLKHHWRNQLGRLSGMRVWDVLVHRVLDMLQVRGRLVVERWCCGIVCVVSCWDVFECERCDQLDGLPEVS